MVGAETVCDRVTLIDRGKIVATESPRCRGHACSRSFRSPPSWRSRTTQVTLMAACGINVPFSYYPDALEWFSRMLPVTNGLMAIRGVFDGASAATILGNAALEAAVAVGWMTIALASFNQLASRGRRDGSLDYGA